LAVGLFAGSAKNDYNKSLHKHNNSDCKSPYYHNEGHNDKDYDNKHDNTEAMVKGTARNVVSAPPESDEGNAEAG